MNCNVKGCLFNEAEKCTTQISLDDNGMCNEKSVVTGEVKNLFEVLKNAQQGLIKLGRVK